MTLPQVWQYGTFSLDRYRGAGTFEFVDGLLHESIHDMVRGPDCGGVSLAYGAYLCPLT